MGTSIIQRLAAVDGELTVEDLEDLRDGLDLTVDEARDVVRELAYQYLYVLKGEKGLVHSAAEAYAIIMSKFGWLVRRAQWSRYSATVVQQQADRLAERKWEASFDGRARLAAERMRDRLLEIDRILPVVVARILTGDIDAINEYVALAKLDADIAGYKAPAKYEVGVGEADDLTEADIQRAIRASQAAAEFEHSMALEGQWDLLEPGSSLTGEEE